MRQLLQAHLDWRAQATLTEPVVGADGVERTHQRSGTRALETLLGTVDVTREARGARGCETLFPLDAELNLPAERYSFGVRRRAAEEATKGAYDEVVKMLGTRVSAEVPKRQVEEGGATGGPGLRQLLFGASPRLAHRDEPLQHDARPDL
jgi:hypothetical protein